MIPKSVSNQTRQDILYSMLLSELVAETQHNRATDLSEWLKLFDSAAGKSWLYDRTKFIRGLTDQEESVYYC